MATKEQQNKPQQPRPVTPSRDQGPGQAKHDRGTSSGGPRNPYERR